MPGPVLVLGVGGLLLGATVPWRVGVGRRLAAIRVPGHAGQVAHGARAPRPGARADRRGHAGPGRDVVLLLDLLDMAVTAGAGVPRALEAVGEAVGGADGDRLAGMPAHAGRPQADRRVPEGCLGAGCGSGTGPARASWCHPT
jgi:hypothetical protein